MVGKFISLIKKLCPINLLYQKEEKLCFATLLTVPDLMGFVCGEREGKEALCKSEDLI